MWAKNKVKLPVELMQSWTILIKAQSPEEEKMVCPSVLGRSQTTSGALPFIL